MAYVLGFISADGSLLKNKRGAYFLELQITDAILLKQIRDILGSNHKISKRIMPEPQKTAYRLQIGSKKIFYDLRNLGLGPKKSKVLEFPKIPKQFLGPFIRGYFDGDGSIWKGNTHKCRKVSNEALKLTFTSCSRIFLLGLKKILKNKFQLKGALNCYGNAYRLNYSTRPALSLYKIMYNRSDICLQRKKKIFEAFMINRGPVV